MPKSKRTKVFAAVKRMISPKDPRLAPQKEKLALAAAAAAAPVRNVAPLPAALYFSHNTALGPPYHILLDTNFINFAIKNKLEIVRAAMDCLLAKCVPVVTDCVMAELEKMGVKYRVALRVAKDPRFERLTCTHKGTYADDCLVNRVTEHRCYIVATCDKDLRRRLRKVPGVPCMFITQRKFTVERMPVRYMREGGGGRGGRVAEMQQQKMQTRPRHLSRYPPAPLSPHTRIHLNPQEAFGAPR